jgi:putative peptidoglycan lipid II flippase
MLRRVDEQQRARERMARFEQRNARRRAAGRPTHDLDELWPVSAAPSEVETMILEPGTVISRPPPATERQSGIARNTLIFGVATGLSRLAGLVRETVASYYFGASGRINAFTVAFLVPNVVRALVADAALSSAFVPVFSDLLEKGQRARAWRVASSMFWLTLLGLSGLSALFVLVAPLVIGIFGDPGGHKELAIGLSRVLFPIVALLGASGIVVGILNSYDHFTVPALSPIFWNLAIIVGLVLGVPNANTVDDKYYVYAGAILVATFIQLLLPMPWLRGLDRGEEKLRIVLDWRMPEVRRIFKLMIPVSLGLGLININALIDTFFASRYVDPKLAPTAISKAFLVYMLPQGMFSVAVATVLFPVLSRLASRGDLRGIAETVSSGLRQIAFLLVPAAVISAVLAEPIIRVLFQRGAWLPDQTPVVAGALAAFSAGLAFNGAMLMLNRTFFALQSNWIPTMVALANLFLNAILDFAFYRFGVWGIPLSTSVCNVFSTIVLVALLRRRLGRLDGTRIASSVTRIAVASAGVAAVSWFVWRPLDAALGRSFPAQVVSLGAALLAAIAAYLIGCWVLRVRELQSLLSLRTRAARG